VGVQGNLVGARRRASKAEKTAKKFRGLLFAAPGTEEAVCVYSAGHVTQFQPGRLQQF